MTFDSLCSELQFARCCSANRYMQFLDAEEKGRDLSCLRGELYYMNMLIRSLKDFIPVGTLLSDAGSDACGLSNTVVGFAPTDPDWALQITIPNLFYNGNPVVVAGTYSNLLLAMNAVMAALGTASGFQWHYHQISDYQFYICSEYARNGDTLFIEFSYSIVYETVEPLGLLTMNVTLAGGVAPATPVYQLDDQCITQLQAQSFLGKLSALCACDEHGNEERILDVELRQNFDDVELRSN